MVILVLQIQGLPISNFSKQVNDAEKSGTVNIPILPDIQTWTFQIESRQKEMSAEENILSIVL